MALRGMLGKGYRTEDAGDRGRIHAEHLVRQSAAGQAHADGTLGDRAKVLQPGEMGRETRLLPQRERRELDE